MSREKDAALAHAEAERRRMRLAQIEADNEHGRQLVERYEREAPRPRFAGMAYGSMKRRRR